MPHVRQLRSHRSHRAHRGHRARSTAARWCAAATVVLAGVLGAGLVGPTASASPADDAVPAPAPAPVEPLGPCDGDITFGERVSCSMSTPTTVRELSFAAAAQDQVRVRVVVTGGSVNPLSRVLRSGSVVCPATFADEYTCLVATSGTHVLEIDGNGSGTGTVSTTIQRLNDPVGCKALPYGTSGKTGAMDSDVEIDCWEHTAAAGERWRVRVVETGGTANLHHEVVRPDGTTVCGTNGNTESTCLLDANGDHRLLVKDDNGLDVGTYRVVLERFPGPTGCVAGTFGASRTLTVADAGAIACVTFAGQPGDQIRIRAVTTGGSWNPLVDVVTADGTTLCAPTFADELTCALTSSGKHTMTVRDGNGAGGATGEARLFLQRLDDPVGCAKIKSGATGKTATIGTGVEIDCFTLGAKAGQRWRLRVVETGGTANLHHEVVRPDGTTVCGINGNTESTCLLDANGRTRVLVKDDNGLDEGTYRVVLERFPKPSGCQVAQLAVALEAEVSEPGALACALVAGKSGDQLRVRVVTTGGTWNPLVDVLAEDGSTACPPTFADDLTCPIVQGGLHTVIVRDGNGAGAGTGTAAVFLQNLTRPAGCVGLPYGTSGKTGSITDAVEIDCFEHSATAGQRWRVRVVETGGTATLHHEVVRPDGTTVCGINGNTESTCLLDANGDFRVLVKDDNGLDTGSYRVMVEKFPGPSGCTAATPGEADAVAVTDAGGMACITVPGASSDQLRVRVVATGGTWNPLVDVLAKDGTTVCGATFADDFTCPLTSAGAHTVIIRDGNGVGAGTGTAAVFVEQLTHPTGCLPLPYGVDGRTAAIDEAVEIDCFERSATAGQRWRIRVVETGGTANLQHEVVRPNGTTVCGLNGNTESTCLLDASGDFRVLVKDDNGLETGAYRVVLQRFPDPVGCRSVTVGGSPTSGGVTLPGTIDCATFTGSAGDVVALSVVATGGTWNPLAEVLRADGTTLCGPTFSDAFSCTLTTNGKHTVVVRDGNGAGAGLGTYTLGVQEG